MLQEAVRPHIEALIEARDYKALKAALVQMEVHDLTELVEELDGADRAVAFRMLPLDRATEVFEDLPIENQQELQDSLSSDHFAEILNEMSPDDRTEFLEELPGELLQRLLKALRGDELVVAQRLLAYPEDSIGRLMTPEYVSVRPDWTVEQVFRHMRRVAHRKETINVVYVVDDKWRLLDELPLEDLVLADPEQKVADLMDRQYGFLKATDDREEAGEIFKKYDAVALPVVNSQGVLVGIVTVDDALDVVEDEATEDFQKVTGMEPLEYSYFGTGHFGMIRKRLPWLGLLLLTETIAVMALFRYEAFLAVLAMFMPLINATAGNTGNQIAGLMIRGFAVNEVELEDWWRVLLREFTRGLLMGVALAVLVTAIVLAFRQHYPTAIAASVAMVMAVTIANMLGAMLPFVFKRIGVDPAVTSGPFIASLMDVTSITIFFSTGVMVLKRIG
jgi:magnesium transporter